MLGRHAHDLVAGIELAPLLDDRGGLFGPCWAGHYFDSPAMGVGYFLREPDVTRGLAALMGPSVGPRGAQQAVSFLRVLTTLTGSGGLREALTGDAKPVVAAEHEVRRLARRRGASDEGGEPRRRPALIDLLFEWPCGQDSCRAVVVGEAKLGATVVPAQLTPNAQEATRRARGGPVTRVLLTVQPEQAKRRLTSRTAARWFALL